MLLAQVVGTVVSSRKEQSLEGLKFLLLRAVDIKGQATGSIVVAADAVGAGLGEMVLFASGSSARQTVMTDKRPVDAVIMAIVDQWEVGGDVHYKKFETGQDEMPKSRKP
ncbi:MAG: EutN/CcmL family microcompartment protein [Phycisphaerae bacterium]|nr:EutN/CcmL family microcompartment protein [Phycisphaerae bacterium]